MRNSTVLVLLFSVFALSACDDGSTCGSIVINDEMTPQELKQYTSCEIVEGDFIIHGSFDSLYWDTDFPAFAVEEITGDLVMEGDFFFDFGFLGNLQSVGGGVDLYSSRKSVCSGDSIGCNYLLSEFPEYFYAGL